MGAKLDMERIAKALGAGRRGKVSALGGYFGAVQLAAEVAARVCVPEGGERATGPSWSEQRLVYPILPPILPLQQDAKIPVILANVQTR